ncbi:hypothetical protein [Desulfitobacterium sp.]|uniref:hypothetical protein n=1 Tax=Desulfitobacterium sp. TaxID=49981 RepID=UPI002B21C34A|nr:hypothetical protein [Desulfitobacterium sp.]MEA4901873.1 hypothetical protein [Desulfitobacterium sp.]
MKTAITIALLIIAAISSLGGIAHEDEHRGRNAAIVAAVSIAALAAVVIAGGV